MLKSEAIEKALRVVEGRIVIESKKQGMEDDIIAAHQTINRNNIKANLSQYLDVFVTAEVIDIEDDLEDSSEDSTAESEETPWLE